jgi:serine phosphatase RsbU (regulator of sigma subunit)
MNKLIKAFKPAITIMNRLKYPKKFALISSIFIMPLSLMMYLLLYEINTKVDSTRNEISGNAYLRPLQALSKDIFRLHVLSTNATPSTLPEIKKLKIQIDNHLNTLEHSQNQNIKLFQIEKEFNSIKTTWQELKTNYEPILGESKNDSFYRITAKIVELRKTVGDKSSLVLDPDLDTFYLMSSTLGYIPEVQGHITEAQVLIQGVIKRQKSTPSERIYLVDLLARIEDHADKFKTYLEIAITNNSTNNLGLTLTEAINNTDNQIKITYDLYASLVDTPDILNPKVFAAELEKSLTQTYILWDKAIEQQDILLQNRINTLVKKQILLSIFVLLILAIVAYLFMGFYLAVKKTVGSLSIASKQMIDGSLTESIVLDNQDELADVIKSFNNIAIALVSTSKEVTSLNDRLNVENIRMRTELDVTREVQQMILPKENELAKISDLEIAGFMLPASEVGGDYYDVIYQDGKAKIGIGDVTGHGLESGMLMLMVQTAIRTLLEHNETDPKKFLSTLNKTIYQNVQRMESDKNMTLCLLDYEAGKIRVSGQHEELLIIRRGGLVQRVDTIDLGFPIGLEEEIGHFIGYADIQLFPGDVVVLYTDGITEAEDVNGEQYGLKQLTDVVKENWKNSAEEIKEAVVKDVKQHIGDRGLLDDMTLVVLRQK